MERNLSNYILTAVYVALHMARHEKLHLSLKVRQFTIKLQ